MTTDKIKLRARRYPDNVQEFDRRTADVLIQRGQWEEVPADEPKPTTTRQARNTNTK